MRGGRGIGRVFKSLVLIEALCILGDRSDFVPLVRSHQNFRRRSPVAQSREVPPDWNPPPLPRLLPRLLPNKRRELLRLRGGANLLPGTAPVSECEHWLNATVRSWRELSSPVPGKCDADTPTRHIFEMELDVAMPDDQMNTTLQYVPGDCVGIRSPNPPSLVVALVDLLSSCNDVEASGGSFRNSSTAGGAIPITYSTAQSESLRQRVPDAELDELIWGRDLSVLPKMSIRHLAAHCSAAEDAAYLVHLASSQQDYIAKVQAPAMNIVELLEALPSCRPSLKSMLEILPPLMPRSYSISSSPLQYARQAILKPATYCRHFYGK